VSGGFVFANFVFGRRLRIGSRPAELLELEQVAEGTRVGALEAGYGAVEKGEVS
jgi:hypothetical protein